VAVSVLGALRQPSRTWPPEDSVLLRVAAAGAVCTGVAACEAQGELVAWLAALAVGLVVVGSLWSYRRRAHPLPYLRVLLGAAMVGAFVWFFLAVSADAVSGALTAVEGALAVLFTAMQVGHAFDLPTRRDLGFSLAGSATLVAVAATQAVGLSFGLLVVVWAAFVVTGLGAAWSSMAGGAPLRPVALVAATGAALSIGVLLLAVLPAPQPPTFWTQSVFAGADPPASQPSHLSEAAGGTRQGPASASGPTGVGGFLGFAGPLDTALRPSLGDQVVLRVRADRPSFWLAETFDTWSGRSWAQSPTSGRRAARSSSASAGTRWVTVTEGPPFMVGDAFPELTQASGSGRAAGPAGAGGSGESRSSGASQGSVTGGSTGNAAGGSPPVPASARGAGPPIVDYQTFYLASSSSNLVLHAGQATAVWFPAARLYVSSDGTIRSGTTLGAGSVYTVLSTVAAPTPADLRSANGTEGLTTSVEAEDLQLPNPYFRVAALARRVTAGQKTVYGKVTALERWIGRHTRYTTAIPPLRPGQDTVDQFLFGSRRGYCEQISTSLAVMLRTLGIPAREAVGYVPGTYDPVTDMYEVEAKDAHAWVQVWFPGYGWQSFDPTAYVPLANPSPGGVLRDEVVAALRRIPVVPTLPIAGVLAVVVLAVRRRRHRPRSWRAAVTRELERAAWRAGWAGGPGETLTSVAARLDAGLAGRLPVQAVPLAAEAERAAWRGPDPSSSAARRLVNDARRVRRAAQRATWRRRLPGVSRRRRRRSAPAR
jgi:transglutaminase-like putative cysteine protease